MTIWKFSLDIQDVQSFEMPNGAKILSVQVQDGTPCLWAFVNSSAQKEERRFHIFGTGHRIPPHFSEEHYIGTVQTHEGALVWHVFEEPK